MDKSLKIIRYLALGGIFLTPFLVLIVASSFFFPFITGKNFTFRILIEITFALWLILAIFDKNYRPKRSLILTALSSFLIILALSSVFGENFYRSFWSNYERMEGLITYLHLFAFFLVLISMMKQERLWKWFFNTSLFVSFILGIYGLLQMAGKLAIHQGGVRLDATLGNATYLAIYMVFHIFLALLLFFKEKKWYRWFYLPIAVLNLLILYHTATRGAILGLIGGLALALILVVLFHPAKKLKFVSASLLGLIVILIAGFLLLKDSPFIAQNPVLSRFSNISLSETTTQSRLVIWKMSWQGFKEKPILGWGLENFNLIFNKYFEPILWKQEPWFDRAHNVFLDRLTTNGFLGLLAYLSLFAFTLYYLWFPRKNKTSDVEPVDIRCQSIILTSMFAAYFFHNLFVFDNLISSILFIAFLAYISTKIQPLLQEKKTIPAPTNLGLKSVSALMIVIFTVFILYYVNVPGILASRDLIAALEFSRQGNFQDSLSAFQRGISRNSFGSGEIREQLSSFTQQILSVPGLDNNFKQKVFDFTVSEMKKQSNQSPSDIRYMVFLGVIYNKAGQYDQAIDILQKAIKLSPKKQQLYFELGVSYLNKKEYDKGLEVLKEAFELDQEFLEARKIYAVAAIFAGKDDLAEELMKNYGGTIITDERFLQAFNERKMFKKIVAIWKLYVENSPQEPQYRVSLAAGYLQVGERQKAIEQLQKAIELEPRFKQQGEYYIKEIQAGRNP